MLARDASAPDDVLAYLGDRFVGAVVGPAQKIGEARRQLALGELLAPGYAALALGMIDGRSPQTSAQVLASGLLSRSELAHTDGSRIDWEPGRAPHSAWGSPALLEPLIDRPAVTRVSDAERRAYDRFARSYESLWSDHIDPIAVRLTETSSRGGVRNVSADVRVLPALRREYQNMIGTVGSTRLSVSGLLAGLSGVVGIGENAELRRELTQMSAVLGGRKPFAFDWLGDYALVGVTAKSGIANAARYANRNQIELPRGATDAARNADPMSTLAGLPVYVAIGVKSRVGAGLFLTALHGLASEAAPGSAEWSRAASYRGTEVVAVRFKERDVHGALYYALTEHALVLSLNETVLHDALDLVATHPPRTLSGVKPEPLDSAQLVVELSTDKGDALYQAIAWAAAGENYRQADESRALASAVLLGAPELADDAKATSELMRAYLGTVVVTPEGKNYVLAPEGVKDPDHGTAYAPVYPALPVPGSPLERVLGGLARVRTALSFDPEPGSVQGQPLASLHARVTLELR